MARLDDDFDLIDGSAWLAGYKAYVFGESCPWGDHSARAGWLAAKRDAIAALDPKEPTR